LLIDDSVKGKISARSKGRITFYKLPYQAISDGDYLCRIDN